MIYFSIKLAKIGELPGDLLRRHGIVGFGAQQPGQLTPSGRIGDGLLEVEVAGFIHSHISPEHNRLLSP